MKRFFGNLNFTLGFILSLFIVIMAVTSLVWTPYDANSFIASRVLLSPIPLALISMAGIYSPGLWLVQ